MQPAIPFLRTATAAVATATSRIPHIEFHILQRRLKTFHKPGIVRLAPRYHSRTQSTFAPSPVGGLYATEDVQEPHTTSVVQEDDLTVEDDVPHGKSMSQGGTGELRNIQAILDRGHPQLTLDALLDDDIGKPFLRYASNELFDKALLQIQPEYLLEPYKRLHRFLIVYEEELQHGRLRKIEERLETWATKLDKIVSTRIEAGFDLSIDACRHLLKWAGSLGSKNLAAYVMTLVQSKNLQLRYDVTCHNYHMQAMAWNEAHTFDERFHLRVLPTHLAFRANPRPSGPFSGHAVYNPIKAINGIRRDVLLAFKRLIEEDLTADEFTFVNLMTAMGREGDMAGVRSVLKSVWNIDVDMLLTYDEDELESPTFYESDSPLRPSDRLLFALAHIFGSNNEARTAWLLIDYVSRNYDLQIPQHVWQEILEWYLILSLNRSNTKKHKEQKTGKIPASIFTQLFNVMMDEPYNIKPSGVMYHFLARNERDRNRLKPQLAAMRNLRSCISQQREDLVILSKKLTESLQARQSLELQANFVSLRHEFILGFTSLEMLDRLLQKLVARTINNTEYANGHGLTIQQWQRQILPDFIGDFAEYAPNDVEYRTKTGSVAISFRDHRRELKSTKNGDQELWIRQLQAMLDLDEKESTSEGADMLLQELKTTEIGP